MAGAGRAWVVRTHSLAALGRALRGALDELGLAHAAPEQAA
jgi:hypothetical protein